MIKKLSIALVFVLGTGTLISANSSVQKSTFQHVDPIDDCREYSHIMVRLIHLQNPEATYSFL